MELFGKEVPMKSIPCKRNGMDDGPSDDYVNIYVRVTERCNASCQFCTFKENLNARKLDFYKLYYALNEVNKKVRINKVSFTGGEPTLVAQTVNDCLAMVKGINPKIYTVVNSNGMFIAKIDFTHLNSYALSRHGIWVENDEIFGKNHEMFANTLPCISDDQMKSFDQSMKDKIHLSCNLIAGFVDSPKKMYEYINHYSKLGFHDFGFVTLMEVNAYCKSHKIDFRQLKLNEMPNTIRRVEFNDDEACYCANYTTYDDEGDLNRWYARHYCDSTRANSTLVFDVDHLKIGFNGPTIFS